MIKLTRDQKDILLDHMNKKLMYIFDSRCGFCTVADQQQADYEETDNKEFYDFCCFCPLSSARNEESCLNTRYHTLRNSENSPVDKYEESTKQSIENRIDYLIDMVNEHTDAKFGWLRNIKGEDRVIDYELKQKEKKDGRISQV